MFKWDITKNYTDDAVKYEAELRLLLENIGIDISNLEDVDSIIKEFSYGVRYGIWTILNFEYLEDNTFLFAQEDIATLSGSGSVDKYKIDVENGTVEKIENISCWMS